MKKELKTGSSIEYQGKQWKITEVAEDNDGEVVYHLKAGDKLTVVKQSELPPGVNN